MVIFPDINSAAKALLLDVVHALSDRNDSYIIIGGWGPCLRHPGHPGTKDVDVLFAEGGVKFALKEVIQSFLKNDYIVSAKHDFQLLKVINVAGLDFVFNVDLLHPMMAEDHLELFVDHLSLDISENEDFNRVKKMVSIVAPFSRILFDGFFNKVSFQGKNFVGNKVTVEVPLIDEAGLVLSKLESVRNVKRPRDAFDIYLTLINSRGVFKRLKRVANIESLVSGFVKYLKDPDAKFDRDVLKYSKEVPSLSPSQFVLGEISSGGWPIS